jgi:hypothetical protein
VNAFSSRPSEDGFPSDTYDLVDACIERVREAAGLDEDGVLPPLPVVAPRRDVVILTKSEVAGETAGDAASIEQPASAVTAGDAVRAGRELAPTHRVSRRSANHSSKISRCAVALCALVALGSASAAIFSSPLGRKPAVARVARTARAASDRAAAFGHAAVESTAGLFPRP